MTIVVLLLALASPDPAASAACCGDIPARVDGRPITMRQVRLLAETMHRGDAARPDRPGAYHNALNELIRRETLLEEAERRRLVPEAASLEAAEREARASFPDEASWLSFLRAQGFDLASYRQELRFQETARALAGCHAEEQAPVATDAEALALYRAYQPPGASAETVSPEAIESWRWQLTRNKRNMAIRDLLDALTAKAKVERYFNPVDCLR
jgi:hypothetical protein